MSDKAPIEGVAAGSVEGTNNSEDDAELPTKLQLSEAHQKDPLAGQVELQLRHEESSCSSSKAGTGDAGSEESSSDEASTSHWQPGDVVW